MQKNNTKNPGATSKLAPGLILSNSANQYFVYLGRYLNTNDPQTVYLYAQIRPTLMPDFHQLYPKKPGVEHVGGHDLRTARYGILDAISRPSRDCKIIATTRPKQFAAAHKIITLNPIWTKILQIENYTRLPEVNT